ncbi:MAG: hypothetical protein BECKG1743D_GA0114223_102614 [Candidatus Kentron sp. G]|nr:MAG: hypothetical protein BECKG1743E_GA0114224_102495 [Candidatus Kentron sp. G]VFN01210.1 MAG: hypothetical protein BECKG1743D_GA0114223_102614 [Candidatus Kentron sp. G]
MTAQSGIFFSGNHLNESIPLFLLTVFGKGEKDNLSRAERNELGKLTSLLAKSHGG